MKSLLLTAVLFCSLPVCAEEAMLLPDFETCSDSEIARFELDLLRAKSTDYKGLADPVDAAQIDVCGVNGIILCDRGEAPLRCQRELAEKQEMLRRSILASLPTPESIIEKQGQMPEQLYPNVWALARGSSAGPDCAGSTPVMEAWCEAREATRRVEMAVLAYQLARDNYETASAFDLGWANLPTPVRPRAREEQKDK